MIEYLCASINTIALEQYRERQVNPLPLVAHLRHGATVAAVAAAVAATPDAGAGAGALGCSTT